MIWQKRDEPDALEKPFENKDESNELSLVVMQTKKNVFFFVIPTKTYDKSFSMKLVNVFQDRSWTHTLDFPLVPDYLTAESNKISFVRLGENRKTESNFSKSFRFQ